MKLSELDAKYLPTTNKSKFCLLPLNGGGATNLIFSEGANFNSGGGA